MFQRPHHPKGIAFILLCYILSHLRSGSWERTLLFINPNHSRSCWHRDSNPRLPSYIGDIVTHSTHRHFQYVQFCLPKLIYLPQTSHLLEITHLTQCCVFDWHRRTPEDTCQMEGTSFSLDFKKSNFKLFYLKKNSVSFFLLGSVTCYWLVAMTSLWNTIMQLSKAFISPEFT